MITDKRSAPLWQVLSSVSDRLGFDVVDDAALKELVPARITKPASKVGVLRVLDEVEVEPASLRTMFRSLARAQKRDYREQIAPACFTHAASSGDVSLCLYDVTTLYFEDQLRKLGYRVTDVPQWHESEERSARLPRLGRSKRIVACTLECQNQATNSASDALPPEVGDRALRDLPGFHPKHIRNAGPKRTATHRENPR